MKKLNHLWLGALAFSCISCRIANRPITIVNNPSISIQLDASDRLGDPAAVADAIDDSEYIVYTSNSNQLKRDFAFNFVHAEGGAVLLKAGRGLSSKELVYRLSNLSYVEYVEPNIILQGASGDFHTQLVPSDPLYKSKLSSGQAASYALEMIEAPKAWDLNLGSENVTVAVVDTGVDATHPDLQGKLLPGKNIRDKNNNPNDSLGHGSHVAGVIASTMNNTVGTTGLAPGVKILPLRILGDGSCYLGNQHMCGNSNDLSLAVDEAIKQGARVINFSLAAPGTNDILNNAINRALAKGIVVVAAAGNGDPAGKGLLSYPAALPGVISVGAVDSNRQKAIFSNYGDSLSVVAPGVEILSAALPGICGKLGNKYCFQSASQARYAQVGGTSQAAPFVSALAALLISRKPDLTPPQVKKIIEDTATDLGDSNLYGKGLINASKALQSLGGSLPQTEQELFIERVRVNPFFIQSGDRVKLTVKTGGPQPDGYGWAAGGDGAIEGNGSTVTWQAPAPGKYQIVVGVQQGNKQVYGSTSVVVFDDE